ncbi:MAG: hypothetical protein LUF92_04550, partial [Clostridiales bacterium]|nr:hypothetical protein [Clostridiales bacterium]
ELMIKDVRSILLSFRISVLGDAHSTVRVGIDDNLPAILQIAGFFIGRAGVLETAVGLTCHHHGDAVLSENGPAF